ncbi:MAG: tetratricopeptide repeat protein [Acidobacteriota bacterium]
MISTSPRYEDLRDRGNAAVIAGDHRSAHALLTRAYDEACQIGAAALVDRARCNQAAVAIELREGDDSLPELRQILMRNGHPRSGDPENCFLAAYAIARYYEMAKDYRKGLFYAQIARDRADAVERSDWGASALNRIGNLLLARSFTEEASEAYALALDRLERLPEGESVRRGQILDNLGYCRVLQGNLRTGLRLLYRSLRSLRRLGAREALVSVHLDLCFGHLEAQRPKIALRHGEKALALAEALGIDEAIKNSLYLLGEAHVLTGAPAAGHQCFSRLERFYPEAPTVSDFLAKIDVRRMINLKA